MALTRVTSKVIQDGTISTADLSTASKSSISGSFNETSSSFSTRTTTLESASSSFAGDLVTIKGSGTTQGVGQSNSPTFAGGTITGDFSVGGTLTAQEIHTEFTSASIIFTSGSTKTGNSTDDIHQMTGSLKIGGDITSDTALNGLVIDLSKDTSSANSNQIITGADIGVDVIAIKDIHAAIKGVNVNVSASLTDVGSHTNSLYGMDLNVTPYSASNETVYGVKINVDDNTTTATDYGLHVTAANNYFSGNVGIGTSSPGEAIHVRGSEPTIKVQEDSTNHYVELEGGGSTAFINFYDSLRFREGTTERARISGNGNVLIGTTDDDARLMVKKIDGTAYGQFVTIEGDTTDNNNYPGISFKGGTLANGYPEIGLSNGGLMFSIAGGYHSSNYNNRTQIQLNGSDGHILFATGGDPATEKMRILSGGNVGIGTTTPQSKLQVATATGTTSHFGGIGTTNTHYSGISLGYTEAGNTTYRKCAIVQEQIGDGAARGHLHFLVDTANDGNSAVLGDAKMSIHGTDGTISTTGDFKPGADVIMANGRGISFTNATDSATGETVQSSLLDDYEEGTYTIDITGTSADGWTNKSGYATAQYVKIGSMVTVSARYETQSADSGRTGTLRFNLPFTVADLTDQAGGAAGSITVNRTGHSLTRQLTAITFDNVAYFNVQIANESGGTETYIDAPDIDGTFEGHFCITFRAA